MRHSMDTRNVMQAGLAAAALTGPLVFAGMPAQAALPAHVAPRQAVTATAGGRWALQRSPHPPGTVAPTFQGVSCTSAEFCMAVGEDNAKGALAEEWDGTRWVVQPTPGAADTFPIAVSCTSARACTMVGRDNAGGVVRIERWNGSRWGYQTSAPGGFSLTGVSCASAGWCMAVGTAVSNGIYGPFSESWDGRTWTARSVPAPTGGMAMDSVSCLSRTSCMAIGEAGTAVAESWNGVAWTLGPAPVTPAQATAETLDSVSCVHTQECIAVGTYMVGNQQHALAEAWKGTDWSLMTVPQALQVAFNGVSCDQGGRCTAAGYQSTRNGNYQVAAEDWSGTAWTLDTTVVVPGSTQLSDFYGISCGDNACTAVGRKELLTNKSGLLAEQRR
ncbi:MAG TPA: hypothetical protein VGS19_01655 [Streptosporangiaceae bacterium]|nr:hypothetical protein [Streptosporangiaceae bacterium]